MTISQSQARPIPYLNYAGTVYHGLDMTHYPHSKKHGDYLLFVGRIAAEKGLHHALDAAEYLDIPLIIAAKVDTVEQKYFDEYIKPRLKGKIQWIGEVDETARNELMKNALAFLHPACWREPFGLALTEAMSCGCPVIGFNRGSIPELIKDGVSGFVVEDTMEMIDAITRITEIDREECRRYALDKFSVKNMVDGYEEIYKKILSEQQDKLMNSYKFASGNNRRYRNGNRLHLQ